MATWSSPQLGPESIISPSQYPPLCGKGHSPIWDCATRVEVRSHRGEKGRPSSASLSPWEEDKAGELEGVPQTRVRLGEPGVGGRWWLWEKRNVSASGLENGC